MTVEQTPYRYQKVQKVTCPRCGYTWDTRSTKKYVTCPNCMGKVKMQETEPSSVVCED